MKTSNISQSKLFGVAGIFAATALVTPLMAISGVSAAAIPKNQKFADEGDCVAKVGKHTTSEIDAYGKDRYDKRKGTLSGLNTKVDNYYKLNEARVATAEAKYKKNHNKASGINADYLSANKKYIKDDVIANTSTTLDKKKKELEAAKSASDKAKAVCSMMYDTRVNSYVVALVAWMRQIDYNHSSQTVNKIRVADSTATYNAKKARYIQPETAKNLVKDFPDTNKFEKQFDAMTSAVKKVTPKSINSESPPNAYKQFSELVPGGLQTFTERGEQTKKISSIRSQMAKLKVKKASTTKKN